MRSKSIILLVLALGCGLVASIGISQVMEARNNAPADQVERTPVFVALTDIAPNEKFTAQNIKLEEWPKNLVPAGALTKLEEVEGKRSRIKLYAGETILANKLAGANDMNVATQIQPGYRIYQVKVDSITGTNNMIEAGDRVDVMVFRNMQSDPGATAAKIVLQDVRVFAVDTITEHTNRAEGKGAEPTPAKSIGLLVTPEQALKLHLAESMNGSIVRLVQRNAEDNLVVNSPGLTYGDIWNESKSNRGAEKARAQDDPDLSDWLEKQAKQAQQAQPSKQTDPVKTVPTAAPSFRMVVLLGSNLTQVEIPSDGTPPVMPQLPSDGGSNSRPDVERNSIQLLDLPTDNQNNDDDDEDLSF